MKTGLGWSKLAVSLGSEKHIPNLKELDLGRGEAQPDLVYKDFCL
jgi:hypothetical protein